MLRIGLGALVWSAALAAGAVEWHVAPNGLDSNPGTAEAPFATLGRAREQVRTARLESPIPAGGATIWIHGGTYALASSLVLTVEDSGTSDRRVYFRAVQGEEVRLIGGRALPVEAFAPVTDAAVQARLDAAAQPNVRCVDLKALGITNLGALPDEFEGAPSVPELFFNDTRMTLARWPNEGWAEIAEVVESGPAPWRKYESDKLPVFGYAGDRPSRWATAPGVWLEGYWCFDWSCETIKLASIDAAKRRITLAKPSNYGLGHGNPAARRYVALNLLEELDSPGEYFIDRDAGRLYFWPPSTVEGARIVLSTLNEPVISLEGASFVVLRGLTVETCGGIAIRIQGGRNNRVVGCTVRNTGLGGISVEGGQEHRVTACDVYDVGTFGLRMEGGDRPTLTPCGHEAVNNHVYRVSRRQHTHAYNVHIGGVGVRLANNLISDAPHQAIGLGGNDHVIEFNEICRSGMETDDSGAFYMGRNPSERGSVLRYNFWHDIGSKLSHGSCAVYFDDGAGGQTVYGNVFYRAAGGNFGAVFLHGGHDNIVENNVFVECKRAIGHVPWNDAMWNEWLTGSLWKTRLLQEVDITKAPYVDRYPALVDYFEPTKRPRTNRADRNVAVSCGSFIDGNWSQSDNFLTDTDPGFKDAKALNFALRGDSEVFKKIVGFEPIPFDKIGLYRDQLRPDLPAR